MKKISSLALLIALLLIKSASVTAQIVTIFNDKTIGGTQTDDYPKIYYRGTDYFILAGNSESNISGDKTDNVCDSVNMNSDIWVVKTDTLYNIIWDKSFGGAGFERGVNVIMLQNGNMLISCQSTSDSGCTKSENNRSSTLLNDYWLCLIDSNGNKIWDKTLGGSGQDMYPNAMQLQNGDFIIAGNSNSPVSGDKTAPNFGSYDLWVIRLDSIGNMQWDNVYGGSGGEQTMGNNTSSSTIIEDTAGSVIISLSTDSPQDGTISQPSKGGTDIWLVCIDSTGNQIWDKRYGGSGNENVFKMVKTSDNGYILTGLTSSPISSDVSDTSRGQLDIWILKLDSMFNKKWDKRYGGNKYDIGTWIEQATDGGYWVAAYSASDSSYEINEAPYGLNDFWIFKTDSSGNKTWSKRFGVPSGNSFPRNFITMPDSSVLICGHSSYGTSPVKTDTGKGELDYWLLRLKYLNCATASAQNITACDSYTSPSGNYNWSASGVYNDTIQNTSGCDSVITVYLTINIATASTQTITACESYTSPSGNYLWTSTGVYNDTIMNASGCDSMITVNLIINNTSVSMQTITACDSYTSPSGNYYWTATGVYNDTIMNAMGCDSVIIINLTINTVDTSVTANAPNLSANAAGAAYHWIYCDSSLIAGATNQSYIATANGVYAVIVTENGCTDTSSCYTVLNVGIDEMENESGLKVYPNPVKDVLIVSFTRQIHSNSVITICDVQGRVVKEKIISESNSKDIPIDVNNLAQGVYLLKVNGNIHRFVKM